MLISRRREGETLQIGLDVEIRIVSIRRNKVVLGIIAPREVKISSGKLSDEVLANTIAAINSINVSQLFTVSSLERESAVSLLKPEATGKKPSQCLDDKTYGKPE